MGVFCCATMSLRAVFTLVLIALTHAGRHDGQSNIEWWQTAQGTADRLTKQTTQLSPTHNPAPFSGPRIELDVTAKYQTILGFGGALTQASAHVFKQLDTSVQQQLMSLYYDAENGIGYTMGRVPIHSCDFSPKIYTNDDMAGDYNLTYFDDELSDDKALGLIDLINAAARTPNSTLAGGKLFGSPWSPPAWMKDNNDMLSGGSLLESARESWALYISKWIAAYNKQLDKSLNIWGVTVQNEPEASQPWESCIYNASYEAEFVADFLGPKLEADHPGVAIIGYDHNKDHLVAWAEELLGANSKAAKYMDGLGFHWYAGNCFEAVAQVTQKFPNKLMIATEATYELSVNGQDQATTLCGMGTGRQARATDTTFLAIWQRGPQVGLIGTLY